MAKDKETTSEKKKSEKKKQPGKVAKWFKDLKVEFKKVVWPSKRQLRQIPPLLSELSSCPLF